MGSPVELNPMVWLVQKMNRQQKGKNIFQDEENSFMISNPNLTKITQNNNYL